MEERADEVDHGVASKALSLIALFHAGWVRSSLGDRRTSKFASNDDVVLGARAARSSKAPLLQEPQLAVFGQ